MSGGNRLCVHLRRRSLVLWVQAWMSLCWRIWLSLKKIRLPLRNGGKKGRWHWTDNYGIFKRPLVISEREKEMVAGATDHPDRADRGVGRAGRDFSACTFYLYALLI